MSKQSNLSLYMKMKIETEKSTKANNLIVEQDQRLMLFGKDA